LKTLFIRGAIGCLVVAGVTLSPLAASGAAEGHATSPVARVWTEPNDGYSFLDSAIASARHSIDLSMYELSDTTLEDELVARASAGVDVRVLLNADYEGTEHNAASYALLHASKVHVEWAPANQIFHAKYVVIDARAAYIGTGNSETADYSSTRDFWVEDVRASDVAAVVRTFDGDFAHSATTAQAGGLVWSPGSTSALVGLIDAAKLSLLVENEEMDSPAVEASLQSAARRGVSVKVVMTESSSWTTALDGLARSGVHVRVLSSSQVYIHAKVICVDCVGGAGTVFIGSENFSTSSLSYNRELGVITTTPKVVAAVDTAVNADYAVGTTVADSAAPPTKTSAGAPITITSLEGSISPGEEDSLSVHVTKPGESCDLKVTLPSGYASESHGLGVADANGGGNITWTWEIGPSTDPGTAHATITCATGSTQRNFTIR
jgi:phosphatidylserine/phosphatidylglycerophosphate/cardiolipin synthase-like enzyme